MKGDHHGNGMAINWLDITIVFVMIGAVLLGFSQGVLRQVFTLLSFYFALVLAAQYHGVVGKWLAGVFPSSETLAQQSVAAFGVFIAASTLIGLLARWAYPTTAVKSLGVMDNVLGAGLGFLSGAVILGVGLMVLNLAVRVSWYSFDSSRFALMDAAQRSALGPSFLALIPLLGETTKPWVAGGLPALFSL
jgi:uncharacterized membrane protein required for colicin V production